MKYLILVFVLSGCAVDKVNRDVICSFKCVDCREVRHECVLHRDDETIETENWSIDMKNR